MVSLHKTEPIKIGFIVSLQGTGTPGGHDMLDGIRLFLEQNQHRFAGRDVELFVEDDEHSMTRAIDKISKLVNEDHVHLLAGTISSNIAYAVAPYVDNLKVPMVLPICGADDLTKRKRYKWLLRTGFSSSQYGLPFGEWVYNSLGYKTVSAFGLDYALGWELTGAFQKTFEESGGTLVQKLWAPQNFSYFSSFLKQITPDADAVFLCLSNLGASAVVNQIKEFVGPRPLIGGGPGFDETVLKDVGDAALGAISVSHHSANLQTAENMQFVTAYKLKYGAEATTSLFSEGAYTAGMWIKKAIESIDGDVEDKPRLLAALNEVELPDAPRGPIRMDAYGNPIQNIYLRRVEKSNGVLQNVVIHTFKQVSQFWKYDPDSFMREPEFSRDYPPCVAKS